MIRTDSGHEMPNTGPFNRTPEAASGTTRMEVRYQISITLSLNR